MIGIRQQRLKWLMVLSLLSLQLFSSAQANVVIKRSYAFYYISYPGISPKGGNEEDIQVQPDTMSLQVKPGPIHLPAKVDTFIVIYVETTRQQIVWDTAWQNKHPFLITAIPITSIPFNAGFIRGGRQVILSPAKGNFLIQLQLSPVRKGISSTGKITSDKLVLKGRYKARAFSWKTGPLKELVPLPPA